MRGSVNSLQVLSKQCALGAGARVRREITWSHSIRRYSMFILSTTDRSPDPGVLNEWRGRPRNSRGQLADTAVVVGVPSPTLLYGLESIVTAWAGLRLAGSAQT